MTKSAARIMVVLGLVSPGAMVFAACTTKSSVTAVDDAAGDGAAIDADAGDATGPRVGTCIVPPDGGCWPGTIPPLECVDFASGIYGSAAYVCPTHCPPAYGGCLAGSVKMTDLASAKTTTAEIRGGIFAAPLEPGTYDVCYEFGEGCPPDRCVRVTLGPADRRAISIRDLRAGTGYIECSVTCDPASACADAAPDHD